MNTNEANNTNDTNKKTIGIICMSFQISIISILALRFWHHNELKYALQNSVS